MSKDICVYFMWKGDHHRAIFWSNLLKYPQVLITPMQRFTNPNPCAAQSTCWLWRLCSVCEFVCSRLKTYMGGLPRWWPVTEKGSRRQGTHRHTHMQSICLKTDPEMCIPARTLTLSPLPPSVLHTHTHSLIRKVTGGNCVREEKEAELRGELQGENTGGRVGGGGR